MKVVCPVCKKQFEIDDLKKAIEKTEYPFCSERCKMVDLGKWLDADYKVTRPVSGADEELED